MLVTNLEVSRDKPALQASDTHPIELEDGSRVVSSSDGLGWRDIHASVTSKRQWSGSLTPIDHVCFAYCLKQSARIERVILGEDKISVLALRPRQFGILPTRVASKFRLTGSADIMMIYLRGSLVERTAQDQFGLGASQMGLEPRVGFFDPLLEQIAMEIVAALDRKNLTGDPPYIGQLATTAASHLLRHHQGMLKVARRTGETGLLLNAKGSIVSRARSYVDDNLDRDLSVDSLAKVCEVTSGMLMKAFSFLGETPHQYIIKRRIECAKQLLIATDLSIAEVAFQTGFSSQSHLSDVFRRITGSTPGAYRISPD
jgi:AraC family transcriptional regulator